MYTQQACGRRRCPFSSRCGVNIAAVAADGRFTDVWAQAQIGGDGERPRRSRDLSPPQGDVALSATGSQSPGVTGPNPLMLFSSPPASSRRKLRFRPASENITFRKIRIHRANFTARVSPSFSLHFSCYVRFFFPLSLWQCFVFSLFVFSFSSVSCHLNVYLSRFLPPKCPSTDFNQSK